MISGNGLKLFVAIGILLAISAGSFAGLPASFLVLAAFTLSLVIGLLWSSLNHLSGDTEMSFDDAYGLAAPTAAEEQKRAVLRALKDLEYERSVGKIGQEDFTVVSAQYREEAKRLIALADESLSQGRKRAEELLEDKLARAQDLPAPKSPEAAPLREENS